VPPKGFHRLKPDGEVRLRGVGIVKCEEMIKDADGHIVALHCALDPETRHGMPGADRKVKGTVHWVSARHAVATEVRIYDRQFTVPAPDSEEDGKSWLEHVNPDAKRVVQAWLEPAAARVDPEQRFQFERLGYFVADRVDHRADAPVFNRTVTLRDTWAKQA
jgi:glutaminyl-tRNA synthetase